MGPPFTLCLSLVELGQTLTASPTAMWGCCVRLCSVAWPWLLSEGNRCPPCRAPHPRGSGSSPRFQDAGRWKMPGPCSARGRAPAAFTSSEELPLPWPLPPASCLLPLSLYLLFSPRLLSFSTNTGNLRRHCCAVGCLGQGGGKPRPRPTAPTGGLSSLQTGGQVSRPHPEPGLGF